MRKRIQQVCKYLLYGSGVGSMAALVAEQWQCGSGSMAVAAVRRQRVGGGQRGGGVGSVAAVAAERWQRGSGGSVAAAWGRRAARWLGSCGGSLAHRGISGGSRAAGAALPPCTATVATKTPAATAMAGALPTINNQLKAAAAIATETVTSRTIET